MGGRTFSTFWTGQTGPYQRLCLASWVAHGFNAVVYTTNPDIELPKDVEKRPAEEILDLGGRVYRYKTGVGQGSPALHSDLFRYKLLLRGGWWLDTDVIVRSDRVPEQDIFVARQADQTLGTAVMRFPADFALTHEAVAESLRLIENSKWTDIGPRLITRLIEKHGLKDKVADYRTAYAVNYTEALKFFDPAARDEIEERVGSSAFVHLWNQIWTIVGFPPDLARPRAPISMRCSRRMSEKARSRRARHWRASRPGGRTATASVSLNTSYARLKQKSMPSRSLLFGARSPAGD